MKAYQIPRPVDILRLHNELEAAGVQVLTVRGSMAKDGESCMYGVVVCEDLANDGIVMGIIAGHTASALPSRVPTQLQLSAALSKMSEL
jgi:hypothetical protein